MQIQISDEATKKIGDLIGSADPVAIANIVERFADNEQLVLAAMPDDRSEQEIRQSAADCDDAMKRMDAGEGRPITEALQAIGDKLGFDFKR